MKVLLVLLASLTAVVGANAQSTIKGRVTDSSGAVLPGVEVVAEKGGVRERAVTDNVGNYEIKGLTAGRYTVTAALAGFKSSTTHIVRVVEGSQNASVDLMLCLAGLREILLVIPRDIDELWEAVAVVARIHITGSSSDSNIPCPDEAFTQTAEVLEVFKPSPRIQIGKALTFRKGVWLLDPSPYKTGEELIAFLFARPGGPLLDSTVGMFRIQGTRVSNPFWEAATAGVTTAEFLDKLRAKARAAK